MGRGWKFHRPKLEFWFGAYEFVPSLFTFRSVPGVEAGFQSAVSGTVRAARARVSVEDLFGGILPKGAVEWSRNEDGTGPLDDIWPSLALDATTSVQAATSLVRHRVK